MELSATQLNLFNNNLLIGTGILQFGTVDQTITNNAGALFYDVATGTTHAWRVANATEMSLSGTVLNIQGNILQILDTNQTIQNNAGSLEIDVATGESISHRINNVPELVIAASTINAPNFAFTENAIAISPIGTHDDFYDAGMLVEVTSATPDTTIIGSAGNRKGVLKMDFTNGVDEFATIKLTPPRNWDASTITVVFKWTTLVEGAGIVRWGVAGVAVADLDDLNAAATNYGTEIFVTDTQTSINQEQFSPRTAVITLANTPTAGDSVYLRIQRTGADAGDTFDQLAQLLGIFVQWGIDAATAT